MTEFGIHQYHQSDAAKVDLVLVHGLNGTSTDTWAGKDENRERTYWPDWIRQTLPDVNIWRVDYDSSLNPWLTSAVPLDEIAGGLLVNALDRGLGARPIHWVGHSMGGLIIKHLLCRSHTRSNARLNQLSRVPTAITFLGTPHHGSDVADWKDFFGSLLTALDLPLTGGIATSSSTIVDRIRNAIRNAKPLSYVDQLSRHHKALGDLNADFSEWLEIAGRESRLIQARNYYETIPVLGLTVVVPKRSAQLSNGNIIDVAAVGEHHFSICKYASVINAVYEGIQSSLQELCWQTSKRSLGVDSSVTSPITTDPSNPNGEDVAVPAPHLNPSTRIASGNDGSDLTDLAWRAALNKCSLEVKLLACRQLAKMLGSAAVTPDELERAIIRKVESSAAECIGRLRVILRNLARTPPSNAESQQLFQLYWLLLVRVAALDCRETICTENRDDFRVPDQVNRLAITVAAHLIFGQGVELSFGPAGTQVENLIDLAALPDEHTRDTDPTSKWAQSTEHADDYSGLRQEILMWKERVRDSSVTTQTAAKIKGAMAEHDVRPLLLDPKGDLATQAIREAARELGIDIVHIEVDGCPSSIAPKSWRDLCDALCNEFERVAARAPQTQASSNSPATSSSPEGATPTSPPVQVNLHQTFSGPVGQSNVTTGSDSPIHAHQNQVDTTAVAYEDSLVLAFAGFEMTLKDDARLKTDLHSLRELVMRKDVSPSAMQLLVRLLPPLRAAAAADPMSSEVWQRLRHAVRAYWPDVGAHL